MKKSTKIIIGVMVAIIVIIVLCGAIFFIDYFKRSNIEKHIFTKTEKNDVGDETNENSTIQYKEFRAIVIKSDSKYIEVKPIEEKDIKVLSDRVHINLGKYNDALYMEGTEVLIAYTGEVMETYPTQIDKIRIQTETTYKTKIEELPEDYTIEQAVKDNCVVTTYNKIYNKDELDRFLNNVNNNVPDFIRWICFTVEGDMIITDTNFEGSNSFRVTHDSSRDKFSRDEDRVIKRYRFSKLETENLKVQGSDEIATTISVKKSLEGDLEELIICAYKDNYEVINK